MYLKRQRLEIDVRHGHCTYFCASPKFRTKSYVCRGDLLSVREEQEA
jgi:hypothetical protein